MDIDGLGEETIDLLFSKNIIRNIADLYDLQVEQLIPLERLGEKSAANIINSIRESKKTPYHRVLFALGIRHVGETVAKTIAKEFRSIEDLLNADLTKLTAVREIGPKIASSIQSFFSDNENMDLIARLRSKGIRLNEENTESKRGTSLDGKSVVISGVFIRHTRDEYKVIIESNGGKNTSSVSGNTSFILAGENMGESKREKAIELGVPMINETEFLRIIGED